MEIYDDMLDLPHPTSTKHPRMPAIDRAAQFSAFAALTGHDAAIRETARLTDRRVELDEDVKAELDTTLRLIVDHPSDHQQVSITYFQADQKKAGGAYVTATGSIKKMDDLEQTVVMSGGERIRIDDIYKVESERLRTIE